MSRLTCGCERRPNNLLTAGEFVRQIVDDDVDRALVSALVGVANQLGMRTVAEQVDPPALVTHLRARRRLPGRVQFMQVPAQPVEDPDAIGNEVLTVADQ